MQIGNFRCVSDDTMDATLIKLMSSLKNSDVQNNTKDPRAVGLLVRYAMVAGTAQQVFKNDYQVF